MSLLDTASLIVTPNGYKASKLYSIVPSNGAGDMDVTRATTATRVNSAGLIESVAINVPRIDYLNSTCPSILVEPQRTNLQTYSEQFDNAAWLKVNASVISNSTTSPDGNNTADTLTISSGGYLLKETFPLSIISGQSYSISIYTKNQINDFLLFGGATPAGTDVYSIINSGNGWYRHIRTRTFSTTNASANIQFIIYLQIGVHYIWGAQLEAGGYATSYIPTTTAAVTRNADVISKTGISSLIGQTEGTIFFDGKINALPVDGTLFGIQKNASNFVIRFGSQGTNIYAQSYNGSANLFFEATPYTLGSRVKAAFAYKAGSYAFYINGVQIATGSNATAIPACDATMFNSLWGSFNDSLSFYSTAALWKTRLTNEELSNLTTI